MQTHQTHFRRALYEAIHKSINQSFITYYRSYGLADLYTDLRDCTYRLAGLSVDYRAILLNTYI